MAMAKFMATTDPHELACRLLEAEIQAKRPKGSTAKQAIEALSVEDREAVMRMARAAHDYFQELLNEMKRVQ